MSTILLLARRELSSYLSTAWGFIILAFVLLIDGLLFNALAMGEAARYSADVLEEFFYFSSGTTMIAGVLLTMRLIAEERQTGTMVLLRTAPISEATSALMIVENDESNERSTVLRKVRPL